VSKFCPGYRLFPPAGIILNINKEIKANGQSDCHNHYETTEKDKQVKILKSKN